MAKIDPRLKLQLETAHLSVTFDDLGDAKGLVDLGQGRTQLFFVMSTTDAFPHFEVRKVWSPVAAVGSLPIQQLALPLLRKNTECEFGYIAIAGDLIIFQANIAADCDPDVLRAVILGVCVAADTIEQQLTKGGDAF